MCQARDRNLKDLDLNTGPSVLSALLRLITPLGVVFKEQSDIWSEDESNICCALILFIQLGNVDSVIGRSIIYIQVMWW